MPDKGVIGWPSNFQKVILKIDQSTNLSMAHELDVDQQSGIWNFLAWKSVGSSGNQF